MTHRRFRKERALPVGGARREGVQRHVNLASGERAAVGRVAWIVGSVIVLDAVFFAAVTPMLPYYADRFDLTDSGSGVLSAAYAAGVLTGALPSGWLGVRMGPHRLLVAGLAVKSVANLVFALGDDIVLLDSARYVQGVAAACCWVGAMGWLLPLTPAADRGRTIGLTTGLGYSGALLGPLIGTAAAAVGPQVPFAAVSVIAVALLLVALRAPHPPVLVRHDFSLTAALRDRGVRVGMYVMALPSFVLGGLYVLNPLRLDGLGATGIAIGAVFLTAAAIQAVGQVAIGRFSDVHGRLLPLLVAVGFGAVLVSVLAWPLPLGIVAVAVVVATVSFGVMYTPATAVLTEAAERATHQPIVGVAIVNFVWALGQALGGATSGALADATPGPAPYAVFATLSLSSAVALGWRGRTWMREGPRTGGCTDAFAVPARSSRHERTHAPRVPSLEERKKTCT
jgi:MFS family permease